MKRGGGADGPQGIVGHHVDIVRLAPAGEVGQLREQHRRLQPGHPPEEISTPLTEAEKPVGNKILSRLAAAPVLGQVKFGSQRVED